VFVRDGGNDVYYHMFSCELATRPEIRINPHEHQGYRWVTPHEALKMDLIHDLDECIKMYYV
jgi:8-oxo-dGTP pyrophosphatase MutT (NUDIX family)